MVITVLLFSGTRYVAINLSTCEERTLVQFGASSICWERHVFCLVFSIPVSLHRLRSSILVQPLSFSPALDEIYVRVDKKMIGFGIQILIHTVKEQGELGAYLKGPLATTNCDAKEI